MNHLKVSLGLVLSASLGACVLPALTYEPSDDGGTGGQDAAYGGGSGKDSGSGGSGGSGGDSPASCGADQVDCSAMPGAAKTACVAGVCHALSCDVDYLLKENQCELIECISANCAPGNVAASTDILEYVRISWTAPTGEIDPIGYSILRDGVVLIDVGSKVLSFDDATAPPGGITMGDITLQASEETTTEGIELTWNAPTITPVPGASASYVVVATYSSVSSKSAEGIQGNRAAPSLASVPPTSFEFSRDGGGWIF